MAENIELLFFDTFSHESSEELNLDLVQFPKPVFITEVRIIPLGARVQADFPGGVRLGATNPSQFEIEFFVNDLSKPGASTFESLGALEYKQNVNIQLDRLMGVQIPTDGLVLRGWYTTITLAVYGSLTKSLQESVTAPNQSIVPHSVPQKAGSNPRTPESHNSTNSEWGQQKHPQVKDLINSDRNTYIESSNLNQDPYNNNYNNEQFHGGDYSHHNFREEWQQPSRVHHGEGFESNKDSLRWENNGSSNIDGSGDKLSWERSKERDSGGGGPRGGYHSHRTLGRRERGNWDQSRHSWEASQPPPPPPPPPPPRKTASSILPVKVSSGPVVEPSRKRPRSPVAAAPSGVLAVAQQQGSSPPKRPYTPPVDPKPPQCDLDVKKETTVNQKFDTLSPGDVESISEGEIPDGEASAAASGAVSVTVAKPATPLEISDTFEGTPASSTGGLNTDDHPNVLTYSGISPNAKIILPTSSAEAISHDSSNQLQPPPPPEAEQFEPILSDEEILDEVEGQFPDIDYHEYIDEMGKHFNPYTCEFQPIQSFGEFGTKPSIVDAGTRLKELTIGRNTTENWLPLAEQAYPLVVCGLSQLNFDQNIIDILISWIEIGLDVEAASNQPQPGYMVRHLKAGIRLSEVMCQCNGEEGQRLVLRLIDKEKLQQRLFMLYRREHMALSIQLMAVSALDASIRTPSAAKTLLKEYPQLVNLLESSHLARTKYAWMSLLRKLHICEALLSLREAAAALVRNRQRFLQSSSDLEAACSCLEEIIRVHKEALYSVAQHRRFLPVTSQFELDTEGLADPYPSLFALYRAECLLESCLVLAASSSSGFAHVFNFLHVLIIESQSRIGLQFLASHPQVSTALVRLLLASGTTTAEELGLAFAYRLQALYHLDQMNELLLKEPTLDPNEGDFFEQLQALCHLGIGSATGRTHLVHILALDATLEPILYVLKHNPSLPVLTPNSENSNTEHESPARLYAADLIVWTLRHSDHVPFLKRYGKELFQLASEANDRLLDALTFLRPLENPSSIFRYDDLSPLCEIVKRHVDTSAQLPGELCTALRILNHLCVPINNCTYLEHPDLDLFEEPILSGGESNELKYKYALLQLFSLDGMSLMTNILKRICEAHPQPQMHSVILAGRRGRSLLGIVLPCLQLLRRMVTQVIRCRGSGFRDLTAIPILLDVFALAQAVPLTATHQPKAATACREAITALLAYTQPTLQAAEAPSNSLWTQALAEVFKWTSASPHSFISGLFILSELLPLTLPVITRVELSTQEISRAINARLLWSAHLHPLASQIHELIGLLGSSSCQPVVQMLRRVCVQLSDLAAPSSLLVMRGVLDAVLNATHSCMTPSSNANSTTSSICSGHATRLLGFLASLTPHASIKCALVQLVARGGPAKNDEKYMSLIPSLISILRKAAPESNSHVQAQEWALSIIQSLCDSELSLAPGTHNNDLQNLANALPPRETLATLCQAVLEHLSEKEHPVATSIAAMRALLVIAEHDYGFQQLRIGLERHHPEALIIPFNKINEHLKDNNNTECLSLLTTSLELVRVCLSLDPDEDHVPRTLTLSVSELAQMLQWSYNANESSEENSSHSEKCPHSLLIIEKLLQELLSSTTSHCDQESLESLYENISSLIRLLNEEGQIKSMDQSNNESFNSIPTLPTPETLLVQFAMRQVSILTNSSEINDDERLGSAYWLSIPLTEENETESDSDLSQRVPCDLIELSRQLIPEFQLVSETDKMYRLNNDSEGLSTAGSTSGTTPVQTSSLIGVVLGNNGSDPSNPNISLSTGIDNNKTGRPFVAPMRGRGGGFGRSIPLQRGGDLFRSRPPNTSRPPSLHVDDFVALEITGQQPTGPTGYNKMPSTANLLSRGGPGSVGASLGGIGASGPGGGNGPPMVSILGNRNNIGNRGIGPRNSARFFGATSLLSPYRRHENGRGGSRGIGMGLRLGGGRGNNVSSSGLSSTSVSLSNSVNVTNSSTVASWPPEGLVGSNSTGSGGSGNSNVGNSMAVRELRMITSSNTTLARSIGGNIWPLSKGANAERAVGVPGTTRRDLLPPRHARTFPR